MYSHKISYAFYGALVSFSLITLVVQAASSDGVFGDYFTNMTGICPSSTVITGFSTTPAIYGTKQCTMLSSILATLNIFPVSGNVGIGTSTPSFKLDVSGDIINAGWYRSRGDTGWYSETYGGGMYMSDSTWVRTWNAKNLWTNGILGGGFGLTVGYGGITPPAGGVIIAGNVGIGTTVPSEKLEVIGNIKASAAISANAFYYSSDKQLKDHIVPLRNSLEKIISLNGYSFDWKSDSRKDIGVIAQEVEVVFPELVRTSSGTGLKSVEYGNLVAPMIEAIKEQQVQINALKAEIKEIKASIR